MRHLALAAVVALTSFAGMGVARAMAVPTVGSADPAVQLVSGGCGYYGHRDYYGRCVPNGLPPRYRGCPPGFHLGPYGQRCFPNF